MTDLFDLINQTAEAFSNEITGKTSEKTNIYETDDSFIMLTVLSGVKKKDLDVSFEDGKLHIVAESDFEEPAKIIKRTFVPQQMFNKIYDFSLKNIDADSIEANLEDGILTVTLPKTVSKNKKKVKIL